LEKGKYLLNFSNKSSGLTVQFTEQDTFQQV